MLDWNENNFTRFVSMFYLQISLVLSFNSFLLRRKVHLCVVVMRMETHEPRQNRKKFRIPITKRNKTTDRPKETMLSMPWKRRYWNNKGNKLITTIIAQHITASVVVLDSQSMPYYWEHCNGRCIACWSYPCSFWLNVADVAMQFNLKMDDSTNRSELNLIMNTDPCRALHADC